MFPKFATDLFALSSNKYTIKLKKNILMKKCIKEIKN